MKLILMSLVITQAEHYNMTELMMKMTNGTGCAENEHFSFDSSYSICCHDDSEDDPMTRFDLRVAPNVCLKSMLTDRRRPRPSCRCDKVFDLKNMIYLRYLDVKPGRLTVQKLISKSYETRGFLRFFTLCVPS